MEEKKKKLREKIEGEVEEVNQGSDNPVWIVYDEPRSPLWKPVELDEAEGKK